MDTSKDKRTKEELVADLERKIAYYETKLTSTLDQVDRGVYVGKISEAKKEIKKLTEKKLTPKVKKHFEDPVIGEKKNKPINQSDSRGSVIGINNGVYQIKL